PEQFILTRHIYVDETDEKARQLAEPALRYFFSLLNRGFNQGSSQEADARQQIKAALYTDRSFNYFRERNRERIDFSKLSWEELDEAGFVIAGNPDTVARKLNGQMGQVGADHFMGMFHIGNLSHRKVLASLDLFKNEVMPQLEHSESGVTDQRP
ncbi:MAG: LLM class flavin-dependent oxidoreductase, partial [Candidatus Binatia bacterium]